MGKKSRFGSGMNILEHISESLETIFWVKIFNFLDADADPGSVMTISDPQHRVRYGTVPHRTVYVHRISKFPFMQFFSCSDYFFSSNPVFLLCIFLFYVVTFFPSYINESFSPALFLTK